MRRQCAAAVWKRDTYRRTGRDRSGFEVHHTRERCSRMAPEGERYCAQHRQLAPSYDPAGFDYDRHET